MLHLLKSESFLSSFPVVPSGTPRNIEALAVDSRSLRLSWEPPLVAQQNGEIRTYFINISVAETDMLWHLASVSDTTLTVEDLHPHYVYSLVISAVTIGPGPYSQLHTVQMPEDGKFTITS